MSGRPDQPMTGRDLDVTGAIAIRASTVLEKGLDVVSVGIGHEGCISSVLGPVSRFVTRSTSCSNRSAMESIDFLPVCSLKRQVKAAGHVPRIWRSFQRKAGGVVMRTPVFGDALRAVARRDAERGESCRVHGFAGYEVAGEDAHMVHEVICWHGLHSSHVRGRRRRWT